MTTTPTRPITQLLAEAGRGERSARDQVWSAIYEQLHRMARGQMVAEAPGHTLQATALVHEAYVRLVGNDDVQWSSRRHFFGAAAQAMRRIRIDAARSRRRLKRGGGRQREPVEGVAAVDPDPAELLAVDEVLDKLEKVDSRRAEVVSLRYFAGLSVDETASLLGVSPRTVDSDWSFARLWLHRELTRDSGRSEREESGDGHEGDGSGT